MCNVVNKNKEDFDINICRPSKWGNPYSHLNFSTANYKVDSAAEAVEKFEEYLLSNAVLLESLPELKYKRLGCVCGKRSPCHGKVLKKYVDQLERLDEFNKLMEN